MASNVVYVNPAASANGSGTQASPLNNWSQVSFQPGTSYLQMAGTTWQGNLVVGNSANGSAPTQIGSYGSGAAPVILGTVDFNGASNVSLSGFAISAGQSGVGVVIQNGSSNIQVSNNTIGGSLIGVWMGNGAAGGDTISGNSIISNSMFGIAVSGVVNPDGQQSVISQNFIGLSGGSGIELEGSNFLVQDNTVLENGQSVGGSSGIHVYAPNADSGWGVGNVITGNTVAGTDLVGSSDGNGVELDQWTSGNTVSANLICGNDGSGLALYDSSDNSLTGNVVFGNDAGALSPDSANGELDMISSLGLTSGNTISGNSFMGMSPDAAVVQVDDTTATLKNTFAGNMFQDDGASSLYNWASMSGGDATYWRDVTGGSDYLEGIVPANATNATNGSGYAFDLDLSVSPFGTDFRFPWQTGSVYGSA